LRQPAATKVYKPYAGDTEGPSSDHNIDTIILGLYWKTHCEALSVLYGRIAFFAHDVYTVKCVHFRDPPLIFSIDDERHGVSVFNV
jgi:hypothetical protein